MQTYKLVITEARSLYHDVRRSSGESTFIRTPEYTAGFIEELTKAASNHGGTHHSNSIKEKKSIKSAESEFWDNTAEAPADWITYIREYSWLFNDIKNFAGFIGTAWGLYEKFKPKGTETKNATMTVFIGRRPITIKQGEDIEEIVNRARADDTDDLS
jgi:hypothetical protein